MESETERDDLELERESDRKTGGEMGKDRLEDNQRERDG